jgi:hypothetical protein
MASSLSISNGVPWDSSKNDYVAQSCATYNLTYSLPLTSLPYQSQINLRSEDIACNITTEAQFWFISPMLQPGGDGTIMWRFADDVPAGRRYRLEISDQNGTYGMTNTFLVEHGDGNMTADQTPNCLSLIQDTPIYHLPQSERQPTENSLNTSSPAWRTCVPAQFLNADDVTPAGGPTSDATSSSQRAPIFWFLVIGLPIIAAALFASLGWIFYARKKRARKTARNSSAVNRAVRSSISKSWPSSPHQHQTVMLPLGHYEAGELEKGGGGDNGDSKGAFAYPPPNYRTHQLSLSPSLAKITDACLPVARGLIGVIKEDEIRSQILSPLICFLCPFPSLCAFSFPAFLPLSFLSVLPGLLSRRSCVLASVIIWVPPPPVAKTSQMYYHLIVVRINL